MVLCLNSCLLFTVSSDNQSECNNYLMTKELFLMQSRKAVAMWAGNAAQKAMLQWREYVRSGKEHQQKTTKVFIALLKPFK